MIFLGCQIMYNNSFWNPVTTLAFLIDIISIVGLSWKILDWAHGNEIENWLILILIVIRPYLLAIAIIYMYSRSCLESWSVLNHVLLLPTVLLVLIDQIATNPSSHLVSSLTKPRGLAIVELVTHPITWRGLIIL